MKNLKPLIALFLLINCELIIAQNPNKHLLLWFDAEANFERFNTSDSIRFYLDKSKSIGITDIVLDVKPITGEVLYDSKLAPKMTDWKGFKRTSDYSDYVQFFIDESHRRGLKIHASQNVFCEGHNFFNRGVVYTTHPEWQSTNFNPDSGLVKITQLKKKYSAMTNPADPSVKSHALAVLKELVDKYPTLDGVILDRARYDGIEADFSDLSRRLFEKYLKKGVKSFPNDIFRYENKKRIEGKYYKKWLEWRAKVIYDFFKSARETVKSNHPNIAFGDYTGAWYPLYYEVGVNWASQKYDPSKTYKWATLQYKRFGYAELLDIYSSGCYFVEVTKEEILKKIEATKGIETSDQKPKEWWYSVEGSAELAMQVTAGVVSVYGGLYVEQYDKDAEQFSRAVSMCLKKTDGLMIFDIVHLVQKGWWDALEKGIKNYKN
jgi:Domain of unknown function/Glycosyl hydrolase-like 10